jgi:hypothetical protein
MLRAVARTLELGTDGEPANELLVRAAVMSVRFPVLVDELLDADHPPTVDPSDPDCLPRWRRRDVQQVLTMRDGSRIDVEALALHYGTFFAPPTPAPAARPAEPTRVVLVDSRGPGTPAPTGNGSSPASSVSLDQPRAPSA